jgi:hypothetical protein
MIMSMGSYGLEGTGIKRGKTQVRLAGNSIEIRTQCLLNKNQLSSVVVLNGSQFKMAKRLPSPHVQ